MNQFERTRLPAVRTRVLFLMAVCVSAMAGDWPAFRGPDGNGIAREDKAPLHWRPGKNIRWQISLPGPGNSSPIVSHGRVFVTCAEDSGKKRNLYCFDRRTGKQLWMQTVEFPIVEPTHQSNPYCGSTPVADGARVVVWHGSPGVFCYDFDGKELWKKDLGAVRNEWGYGSSPILHRGKVILNFGPGDRAFLTALDLEDGQTALEIRRTPAVPKTLPQSEIGARGVRPSSPRSAARIRSLCSMLTQVVACDPKTGCQRYGSSRDWRRKKVDLIYKLSARRLRPESASRFHGMGETDPRDWFCRNGRSRRR